MRYPTVAPRSFPILLPPLALTLALAGGCADDDDPASRRVQLVQYASCSALEADLKQRALAELDVMIQGYGPWGWDDGVAEPGTAPEGDSSGGADGGRTEGTDYSGTNNQEDGVDEADLVKTDGHHIYLLNGNRLHTFAVPEFGQLVPLAEAEIEGMPAQLLLDAEAGRAAVFSTVYVESLPEEHPMRERASRAAGGDPWSWRTAALSKITVLDVTDPAAPALERELWLEGWYQTARRTDRSVRVVVNGHVLVPGLDDWWSYAYDEDGQPLEAEEIRALVEARIAEATIEDLIPRMIERLPGGAVATHSLAGEDCRSFYHPTDSVGRSTTSILSFQLTGPLAVDADTVVSNWSTVYASRDRLYLAESSWSWWWPVSQVEPGEVFVPATNLHAFDVSEPGQAAYVGSGRIQGNVLNQFSLDEEDGLLRVAATTTPWRMWSEETADQPAPQPESHVYVLAERAGGLEQVGHLGGIAPGEQIFSARFTGEKAFMITFEQIDPLFTIDLSSRTAPRLVGHLEIEGFSSYLHPIEGDRLLAIGVGGDETGANWRTQINLFDVANFEAPALMDAEELVTEGWGWSEAQYEHKAFQYFAPKKLLAVPLSSYTEAIDPQGNYTYDWSSRLEVIRVDDGALSRVGAIDHSIYYDAEQWWGSPEVRRSIFMGDFLYVISARALTVHRLDGLAQVEAQALPGTAEPYWWW